MDWVEFANYTITTLQVCKVNLFDLVGTHFPVRYYNDVETGF